MEVPFDFDQYLTMYFYIFSVSRYKVHGLRMTTRLRHQIRDAISIEKLSLQSPTVDLMPISTITTMVKLSCVCYF